MKEKIIQPHIICVAVGGTAHLTDVGKSVVKPEEHVNMNMLPQTVDTATEMNLLELIQEPFFLNNDIRGTISLFFQMPNNSFS